MKLLFQENFQKGVFEVFNDKPDFPVIEVQQTHSPDIIEYQGQNLEQIKADGIIIDPVKYPKQIIAIKTADCLPILFIGKKICLIHAGWKGLQNNILTHPLLQTCEIDTIFIGPSIYKYEVTAEFQNHFPDNSHFHHKNDKLYFDLQKEAVSQLTKAHPEAYISESDICTFENSAYNSYRRDKTEIRNWNIFKYRIEV